jgi:hypothetical protein
MLRGLTHRAPHPPTSSTVPTAEAAAVKPDASCSKPSKPAENGVKPTGGGLEDLRKAKGAPSPGACTSVRENSEVEAVFIPAQAAGLVMGKHGRTISRIKASAGCSNIHMGHKDRKADCASEICVEITGPRTSILNAKEQILAICKGVEFGQRKLFEQPILGEIHWVQPHEVHFTHNQISKQFRSGMCLDRALQEISAGRMSFESLPPILCVEVVSKWFSLNNRRLYVPADQP